MELVYLINVCSHDIVESTVLENMRNIIHTGTISCLLERLRGWHLRGSSFTSHLLPVCSQLQCYSVQFNFPQPVNKKCCYTHTHKCWMKLHQLLVRRQNITSIPPSTSLGRRWWVLVTDLLWRKWDIMRVNMLAWMCRTKICFMYTVSSPNTDSPWRSQLAANFKWKL